MAEDPASHGLQIALSTLKERCKNLQYRVAILEDENVTLKKQCSRYEDVDTSLNEMEFLVGQVAELTQQKEQLQKKVVLVTNENQELWTKLTKLIKVNTSLGSQLTKINDKLSEHSETTPNKKTSNKSSTASGAPQNLARSKTFTRNELQTKNFQKKLDENDRISLELEDISLKLSDSFSKQKIELDMLCSEISNITFTPNEINTENCGFLFDEELENDIFMDINNYGDELILLKDIVLQQQAALEDTIKNMNNLQEKLEYRDCQSELAAMEKCTSTTDLHKQSTFEDKSTQIQVNIDNGQANHHANEQLINSVTQLDQNPVQQSERMCPVCSKIFQQEVDFNVFVDHVEDHFSIHSEFELLYFNRDRIIQDGDLIVMYVQTGCITCQNFILQDKNTASDVREQIRQ